MAVPDGYGDSAECCRGGEQEAGAPETPVFRGGGSPSRCLVYGDWFGAKLRQFTKGHGDLSRKNNEVGRSRNLFFESASMVEKGEIGAQKIQESVFKKFENAFFYEI